MSASFIDGHPRLAFYGDDFTGATDTLATATRAGLRSLLFLRVPDAAQLRAAGPLDCIGIAGAARSMDGEQMRAELTPVARFFASLQVPVTHYKICSTFDSGVQIGNIGAALRIWRETIDNPFVPMVGGQPNLRRFCLFSHLFAAEKAGGEVVRIDRHPTMRCHPVTPMDESDLRKHLARQGLTVQAVHYPQYLDPAALDDQIDALSASRPDAVLFDVSGEADLPVIGGLIWARAQRQRVLAVGASSVVQALAAWWQLDAPHRDQANHIAPARGPVLVLAGSLSPITAQQIGAAHSYDQILLDPQRLIEHDQSYLQATVARIADGLRQGRHMLACTAPHQGERQLLSASGASQQLAHACGELLRRLLQAVPLTRVGVAGGDTSSHALKALDIWGLSYIGNLSAGVALCRAHADLPQLDGVELMLKGGQMGGSDLFELLVRGV
ncbi:four-carbon acid sugar kinase family protein [Herbaspirillum sp. alder98]|uniref:four-carbon acid sugar kinase family protein n=1 Tax=Herbaspirillum sp. alder98 TaxID=2913096 RepID=UPI001CD884BD|nr:four-carbon acid sugar kinase family protein [Herbaspirillum sp. alder98]MCA1325051.1 four-carbon acid sugar kinase family protein [Herbaspirillum sp. alder98]